jgi:uncharacterized protein YjdB
MAAVYFARDLRLNRKVAIKVMLPSLGLGEGFVDRFEEEARTAAKLDHPHIVTIYSVEEVGDLNYFVMKFIDGASLEELTRGTEAFPFDAARLLLTQVSDALHYAHTEGVVHRDVKPANVMVDTRGMATVTDFGISKTLDSPSRTQTGSVIGTPAFMSPEQWSGRPATAASDQYALGILGYQMLVGHTPFAGNQMELRDKHVNEPPSPIVKLRPDCPPQLAAVVMRMIEKVPDSRWPNLKAASTALRMALPSDTTRIQSQVGEMVTRAKSASNRQFEATPMSPTPRTRAPDDRRPVSNPTPIRTHQAFASGGTGPAPATPAGTRRRVAQIVVTTNPGTVRVGEQTALHADVTDETGRPITGQVVAWASSDPAVAQVDPSGRVLALAPGVVTLSAIAEGERTEVRLRVEPAPAPTPLRVHRVVIAKPAEQLVVGRPLQLAAAVFDERGQAMARPITWSCDPPSVATISRDGTLRGVSAGRATISADAEGVSGQLTVQVQAEPVTVIRLSAPPALVRAGDRFQLTATPLNASQSPLVGRVISWKSDRSSIASVNDNGMVTASRSGSVVITATCEHQSATVSVEIQDLPLATIELAPSFGRVEIGKRLKVSARAKDARGTRLDRPLRWVSSDESIARVSVDGEVAAVREGEVTISAHAEGVQGAMGLQVVAARERSPIAAQVLAFVTRQPRWVWAIPGALVLFLIVWPFIPSSGPTVDEGGGTGQQPPPPPPAVQALRLSGVLPSMLPGDTVSLLAEFGSDAAGWTRASEARWSTRDPRVAVIDSVSGLVTAVAAGRTTVVALMSAAEESLAVTVSDDPVQTIEITPARREIGVDETLQLRARGRTSRGRSIGEVSATWATSDPRVITIDPTSGAARGVGPGTATITAQAGTALVNQLTLTVASAPARTAARLVITAPASLPVGGTAQLSARVFDSRNQAMDNAAVAWSVDRPDIASIDASTGTVRARGPGAVVITATSGSVSSPVRLTIPSDAGPSANPGGYTPAGGGNPPPGNVVDESAIGTMLRAYTEALSNKNADQITTWYHAESDNDRKNLKQLTDLMRNGSARFRVAPDSFVYSSRTEGARTRVVDFTLKLEWRGNFGRTGSLGTQFRAEMRWTGTRWEIVNCRIIGKPPG